MTLLTPLGHLLCPDNEPFSQNMPGAFVKPLGESGVNPWVPGHFGSRPARLSTQRRELFALRRVCAWSGLV